MHVRGRSRYRRFRDLSVESRQLLRGSIPFTEVCLQAYVRIYVILFTGINTRLTQLKIRHGKFFDRLEQSNFSTTSTKTMTTCSIWYVNERPCVCVIAFAFVCILFFCFLCELCECACMFASQIEFRQLLKLIGVNEGKPRWLCVHLLRITVFMSRNAREGIPIGCARGF